ncbi:ABC transporter substrate-binding protein/permease [bacterium]|nr:ABC transporter substrate-binding protein/permease [bacterium]
MIHNGRWKRVHRAAETTNPHKMAIFLAAILLFPLLIGVGCETHSETDPFTVALTGKYPPFSFYDSETGELTGFDVDIARDIANHLGRPLQIVATEWDGILPGLLAGKYDAIIGSMAITPEREEKVDFSSPYYVSGAQLFVHERNTDRFNQISGLAGEKIGVVRGETFEQFLREEHPEIQVATYKSTVEIFQEVRNGRIEGFVTDRLVGLYQIKTAGMPFTPAGPLLYQERMGIPVRPEEDNLLLGINRALSAMEKKGQIDAIHTKWFGRPTGDQTQATPPAVAIQPVGVRESSGISTAVVVRLLAHGFGVTLFVAIISLSFGFLLAIPAGIVLHHGRKYLLWIVRGAVDFIRGTPVLIQLYFVYYGLGSEEIGLNLSPITAAILTLTINTAAYMSEIVRSGLMAVDPGQRMAARALGLNRRQVFHHVVWPQAFRVAMPPLMNSTVALLKDTALISVIAVNEVISATQSIISVTFDPTRYYLIVAALFFIFTFPLMKLAGIVEASLKRKGFEHA